ncbi:MAG: dynamin family protein [Polyangiaceae bacterium]|nr:dynamin family protein [Polyangiaceae bacterium]
MAQEREKSVAVELSRHADNWAHIAKDIQNVGNKLRDKAGKEVFHKYNPTFDASLQQLRLAVAKFRSVADQPELRIATSGTTSSGKSTLANMLIGAPILPKAVQEMSSGVVKIHHSETARKLIIEDTRGATWDTGEWNLSTAGVVDINAKSGKRVEQCQPGTSWDSAAAAGIRKLLADTMEKYRGMLDENPANTRASVSPPSFIILWPTLIGRRAHELGLPAGADTTILDLPGLKFTGDEVNGEVIKKEAKNALCIVAYNSAETDGQKQEALLEQVVDQVKSLRGRPARMLFVLNRIDVFGKDEDPKYSKGKFKDRVQERIQQKIRSALPEFTDEAKAINPIPLSSELALYATQAQQFVKAGKEDQLIDLFIEVDDSYAWLFPKRERRSLDRDPAEWTGAQRDWFIKMMGEHSNLSDFDDKLRSHIQRNFLELVIPDLVQGTYCQASDALNSLAMFVKTFAADEEGNAKRATDDLEDLHQSLLRIEQEALGVLGPIRLAIESDVNRDYDEFVEDMRLAVREAESNLARSAGGFAALIEAYVETVRPPIQRLISYVAGKMAKQAVDDHYIQSVGSESIDDAVDKLRTSPYGACYRSGGRFIEHDGVEVKAAVEKFTREMSSTAEKLIIREGKFQSDRIASGLEACLRAVVEKLETEAAPELECRGFPGFAGVFRYDLQFRDPPPPSIRFYIGWSKHTEERERIVQRTRMVKQRTWYTLWLGTTEVEETYNDVVTTTAEGVYVESFDKLIGCITPREDLNRAEEHYLRWMRQVMADFDAALKNRLHERVQIYRQALEQRREEIELGTQARIEGLNQHSDDVTRLKTDVETALQWRQWSQHG